IDQVKNVNPETNYRVRVCARHPVYENHRIHIFQQLIRSFSKKNAEETLEILGELMFQSQAAYTQIGLGNTITDEIVSLVREAGHTGGVYGARITGGGSGGTVCVLAYGSKGKRTVKEIHEEMCRRAGHKLFLFTGSSNGAVTLKK
ncbi:MAG TPA: hypothetical protein VM012_09855, partial [Flavitalea sp.]|nr:hypothetical protein [Flavitalea sp.]